MKEIDFRVKINIEGTYDLYTEHSLSCGDQELGQIIAVIVDRLIFETKEHLNETSSKIAPTW